MSGIFWFGDEVSADAVVTAQHKAEAGRLAGWREDLEASLPKLWEKQGSTAVVRVEGNLINGTADSWDRMYGIVGYENLAQAALEAYSDPEVKQVMWHIESPGGHVAGLADFGRFVTQISGTKPSAVYTPSKMASAAYWIGASVQGQIYMDDTAEVGSLGVLMIHAERSKQLEAAGIKATIFRAGEMKARINPIEPVTEEAATHLNSQLADLHDLFKAHVKKARPGMTAANLKEATDGRTFLGKRGVAIGLADRTASVAQAFKLLDKHSSQKHTPTNSKGATTMIVLTESQIARIQAGATLEDLGVVVTPPTAEEQAAEKAAADKAAADKIAADKAAADAAAAAGEKGATEGTGLAAADAAIVAHLQTQVDAKAAQVATLTGELTTLKASHSAMQATHDGLMTIVRQATTNMLIPMGGSGDALAALPADQLVAQYNETRTKFLAKFPVGGKGMVAKESGTSAAADVPVAFAAHAARISKSN